MQEIFFVHFRDGNESPLEKSGCFNYFTVGWITGIMLKAFRSGLGYSDLFRLPTLDQSKESAARLQRLWEEEQENANKMNRQPSFAKACAKFCQTRVIISSIFFSCCVVLQFLSPVIIRIKSVVDFLAPVYKILYRLAHNTQLTGGLYLTQLIYGKNYPTYFS